jgi:hypothetical protein
MARMRTRRPPLTVEQVLAWADAHFARTGRWPSAVSGPVADAAGETWAKIHAALYDGHRGFPGGDSLARLLDRYRRRWAPEEDELVWALPPAEAARRTGRSLLAVYVRRYELGVPDRRSG